MAELMEDREAVRARKGKKLKAVTRGERPKGLGPVDSRTVQFPRNAWKDLAHLAVEEETSVSALIVQASIEKLRQRGYRYDDDSSPVGVSASQEDGVNNSGEADPVAGSITPADGEGGMTAAGEGEGTTDAAPARGRKARAQSSGG